MLSKVKDGFSLAGDGKRPSLLPTGLAPGGRSFASGLERKHAHERPARVTRRDAKKTKSPHQSWCGLSGGIYPGSDLLSHAVAHEVPSALEGLTSVFGMGTGVAPPLWPPGIFELASGSFLLVLATVVCL